MIAIATVLSMIKLIDLPYGGSVTAASMLPIVLIAYRHGIPTGLTCGLVYGILQQLLGLNTLSYVSTWQSIVAVIMLDYIIAFLVIGFAGIFRKVIKNQPVALSCGALFVCVLRYACHVISGATVWAGLSIPTSDALIYSFAYNATYMIPETFVLIIVSYFFGSALDLTAEQPVRVAVDKSGSKISLLSVIAGLVLGGALIFDITSIFSKLQDAETGNWNALGLSDVRWTLVLIVTAAAIAVAGVLLVIKRQIKSKQKKNA